MQPTTRSSDIRQPTIRFNLAKDENAEPIDDQAIDVFYQRLGETHPTTQTAMQSFLSLVQQVIQENQIDELSEHPMTRSLLDDLQQTE